MDGHKKAENKKKCTEFLKEYFSVPNILGYVRIVLVFVYLAVYINADTTKDFYCATAVLFASMLTDFLDGQIARRFHMVTQWGKMLDPFADKLTLGIVFLGFTFRYPLMFLVLFVFLVKELFMGIAGLLLMKTGWRTDGAMWCGKVATAGLYAISILMLCLPGLSHSFLNLLMAVELLLMLVALIAYMELYWEVTKELRKTGKKFREMQGENIDMKEIKTRIKERHRSIKKKLSF